MRLTLDKVFQRGLEDLTDEMFDEFVAQCDVCRRAITRAELHVKDQFGGNPFGCVVCRLQTHAGWKLKGKDDK